MKELPEMQNEMGHGEPDLGIQVVQDTMQKMLDVASVEAVYGKPVKHGESLIIPTAEVISAAGFGVGYGTGPGGDEHPGPTGGGGGGGGGRVFSRPVAVIIASPEGVRIEPVFDITKIALAALTAGGFMLSMLARMRSTSSSHMD